MNRKDRAPASGEQAAITGFFKQYEFFAAVIFRLMQQGKFDGIAISDPTAGIFDDLVIFSDNQIIAHQAKTERYATRFAHKTETKAPGLFDSPD